ncbi:hypothetical protein BDZ89DRAFT_1054408 [Hymenopellis radicata]|nr:hypothetical protein BDZ89DRAFT_1054408 [Hymenopellis radicata]
MNNFDDISARIRTRMSGQRQRRDYSQVSESSASHCRGHAASLRVSSEEPKLPPPSCTPDQGRYPPRAHPIALPLPLGDNGTKHCERPWTRRSIAAKHLFRARKFDLFLHAANWDIIKALAAIRCTERGEHAGYSGRDVGRWLSNSRNVATDIWCKWHAVLPNITEYHDWNITKNITECHEKYHYRTGSNVATLIVTGAGEGRGPVPQLVSIHLVAVHSFILLRPEGITCERGLEHMSREVQEPVPPTDETETLRSRPSLRLRYKYAPRLPADMYRSWYSSSLVPSVGKIRQKKKNRSELNGLLTFDVDTKTRTAVVSSRPSSVVRVTQKVQSRLIVVDGRKRERPMNHTRLGTLTPGARVQTMNHAGRAQLDVRGSPTSNVSKNGRQQKPPFRLFSG